MNCLMRVDSRGTADPGLFTIGRLAIYEPNKSCRANCELAVDYVIAGCRYANVDRSVDGNGRTSRREAQELLPVSCHLVPLTLPAEAQTRVDIVCGHAAENHRSRCVHADRLPPDKSGGYTLERLHPRARSVRRSAFVSGLPGG